MSHKFLPFGLCMLVSACVHSEARPPATAAEMKFDALVEQKCKQLTQGGGPVGAAGEAHERMRIQLECERQFKSVALERRRQQANEEQQRGQVGQDWVKTGNSAVSTIRSWFPFPF